MNHEELLMKVLMHKIITFYLFHSECWMECRWKWF